MNERLIRLYQENKRTLGLMGLGAFGLLLTVTDLTPAQKALENGFNFNPRSSREIPPVVSALSIKPTPTPILLPAELRTLIATNPEMHDLMVFVSEQGGDLSVDDYGEHGAIFEVDMPEMGLGIRRVPYTPMTDGEVLNDRFIKDGDSFSARYGIRVMVPNKPIEESLLILMDSDTKLPVDVSTSKIGNERFIPGFVPQKIGRDTFVKVQTASSPTTYQILVR